MREASFDPAGHEGTLEATKSVLAIHFDALEELLPPDFPASKIMDLKRHIHFCHVQDCVQIVAFDVPDILQRAEQYALHHVPSNPSGDLGDYLHPKYRTRLDQQLLSTEPDFHALVLKACVILGDTFKEKAGVSEDKDSEIGRAFKPDDPILKVTDEPDTDTGKNFQRGAMLLMQGVRAFYRNTFAHGEMQVDARQAVHALMMISMLTEMVEHSEIE